MRRDLSRGKGGLSEVQRGVETCISENIIISNFRFFFPVVPLVTKYRCACKNRFQFLFLFLREFAFAAT